MFWMQLKYNYNECICTRLNVAVNGFAAFYKYAKLYRPLNYTEIEKREI